MEERYMDEQEVDERLFELYVSWCDARGLKAKLNYFNVWLEENYP